MASTQCMLTVELEGIERKKFNGSLAKRQIHQYFPPSIDCTTRYIMLKVHHAYIEFILVHFRGGVHGEELPPPPQLLQSLHRIINLLFSPHKYILVAYVFRPPNLLHPCILHLSNTFICTHIVLSHS